MRPALAAVLVALAAPAALTGCDTVSPTALSVEEMSHDPALLVGTWDLDAVTGSGESLTPPVRRPAAEAGQAETLTFRADGTAVRSGDLEETTTWEVRRVDYGNGTQSDTPYLYIGGHSTYFGIQGGVLYLDDRYVDGELREFVRR